MSQMLDLLLNRRSVRKFKNQEVSDEIISTLLEAGTRAPTAGNLQSYSIIITKEPERLKVLADIHLRQEMMLTAPLVLTFCVNTNRNSRWCKLQKAEPGFQNFWWFLLGMADAWSAAQNITIAAQTMGLGSCHSGATFIKTLNLIDFFECPHGVIPVATLAMGFPAETPSERPRLPLKAIVHNEKYSSMGDDVLLASYSVREKVDFEYYQTIHGLFKSSRAGNIDNLAKIYTTLKYRSDDTKLFSENFITALKKQGFL